MSISTTLRRAAKLQEKIEDLRGQLTQLLDRARAEVVASSTDDMPSVPRRPKMFKSNGHRQGAKPEPKSRDGKVAKVSWGSAKLGTAQGTKRRKRSPLLGMKRAASPSGPLAPAVVEVLQAKHKPMNVSDILSGLTSKGYKFTSSEPKKNLAARIYRLKGVRQVSAGLFAAV